MARIKGLKGRNGKRHQVTIQDITDEGIDDDYPIWIGTSAKGTPKTGSYVSREKFLQAVATALNVEIIDRTTNGAYYVP